VLAINPILDRATLEDLDKLRVEDVVSERDLITSEDRRATLLSLELALDDELDSISLIELRLDLNTRSSLKAKLTISSLDSDKRDVDSRDLGTRLVDCTCHFEAS